MKIVSGLKQMKKFKKPVVALGVFDGVHRGHRNILQAAVRKARSMKGTSIVLTFWPHPQKKENLYSLEHRLRLFEELGIDVSLVINFNQKFARISAADFIRNILFPKLRPYYVYVGRNFRFGKNAEGNFQTLKGLSQECNFKLKVFPVARVNNQPISSTYIRRLIKKGKLHTAKRLLSRPVSILGTVMRGISLGRKLGFPTANINPHHEVIPPKGVYAVKVILQNKKFNGLCYIGSKPTFKIKNTKHIEVFIFNFKKNIYGKYLEIQFRQKIRKEKKFDSPASLAKQVLKDIKTNQDIFTPH